MNTKQQKRILVKARKRWNCRTFVGYIGLIDGRPDVFKDGIGTRQLALFTSERKARLQYADVSLVTVTGIWEPK